MTMDVVKPSLRQLEYVVAIDDHGSFSDAARACGVTQPALSTNSSAISRMDKLKMMPRRTNSLSRRVRPVANFLPSNIITLAGKAFRGMIRITPGVITVYPAAA